MAVEMTQSGPLTLGSKFSDFSTASGIASIPNRGAAPGFPGIAATANVGASASTPSPVVWFIGAIILLAVLKFLGEHPKTAVNPAHIHIGGYNILTIWVIVLITVVGSKILFNRFPVPGVTPLVNAT